MSSGRCGVNSRAARVVALLVLLLGSCERLPEEGGERGVSIRHLLGLYSGSPRHIAEPIWIEGEVIATDRSGEFYNRILLQDSTAGVAIMVDCDTLHRLHVRGDRLKVECQGLCLGAYGHSVRIGVAGTSQQVEAMSLGQWNECHRSLGVTPTPISPTPLRISSLGAEHIATLALFEGVRFVEAGESWAEEGVSQTRHLVDCEHPNDTLCVRLSGYSEFYEELIPSGECSVVGVVDYFATDYQLLLESPDGVLPHSDF